MMADLFGRLGRRLFNLTLLVLCILVCVGASCWLLMYSPDFTFNRFLEILSAVSPLAWPCVALLVMFAFYASLREAIAELPAFVRRSHYGEGTGVVSDVSIHGSGRKVMTVHASDNADTQVRMMRDNDYSACPVILEHELFYGVFTIDAWVDYQTGHAETHNATIQDVLSSDRNLRLLAANLPTTMFVEQDATLCDARNRLHRLGDKHFPLILLSLSEKHKLLDMITIFDLLNTIKTK